jgi:WD40 repeat protein
VLICGDGGAVELWDVATRRFFARLHNRHKELVRGCDWSPDGTKFVTASDDKTLKLWSAAYPFTCTATLRGHTGAVVSCVWSPDGLTIASGSEDKTVKLWDAATGSCCATLKCSDRPGQLRWSRASRPDGAPATLAICDGLLVALYDVQRTQAPL